LVVAAEKEKDLAAVIISLNETKRFIGKYDARPLDVVILP
jgi:hypothetical protein